MKKFGWALFLLGILIACQATPPPPPPTATPPEATETVLPPTATATQLAPTPTQVATVALPTTISAPSATPQTIVTGSVKSDVNVREQPAATAKILGQLRKAADVTLLGRNPESTYFFIPFPQPSSDTRGWVLATVIATSAQTQTLPVVTGGVTVTTATAPAETPTSETSATPSATGTATGTSTPTLTSTATLSGTTTVTPTPTRTVTTTPTLTATLVAAPTQPSNVGAPSGSVIFDVLLGGHYGVHSVHADGSSETMLFAGGSEPALAPNGRTVAVHVRDGSLGCPNLAVLPLVGGPCITLTKDSSAGYPTWSPDGNNIAFHSTPTGSGATIRIFRVASSGAEEPVFIGFGRRPAWQPVSGLLVAFDGCKPDGSACSSIFTVPAFGGDPNNPTLVTHGTNPAWSPDGRRIAFQDLDGDGNSNIFVVNRDGTGRAQVTKAKGNNGTPIWSADGAWLFYRSDQNGTAWAIKAIRSDGAGDRRILETPVSFDWDFEKLAISR